MIGLLRKRTYELAEDLLSLRIDEGCYVVVDTELTGLDYKKDSIVSIGGIKMTGGRIEMGKTFYKIVSPKMPLTSKSVVVHGITPSDVRGKPSIDSVMDEFIDFCNGYVVVGHFLSLDLKFLNKELKRLSHRPLENPVADTFRIHDWIRHHNGDFSRHFGGMTGDRDLFSIAKKYKIQVSETHNALMDAFITAQLFQRFLSFLPELGVTTIKELLKIGKP